MGLRTAVQTLADLDLDLANSLWTSTTLCSATCLYAVYDAVTGQLTVSTDGHPPPAVLSAERRPSRSRWLPVRHWGAPACHLRSRNSMCLPAACWPFTDGSVASRGRDIEEGMARLRDYLAAHPDQTLDEASQGIITKMLPQAPGNDAAVLLVRTHRFPPSSMSSWEFEANLPRVARAPRDCRRPTLRLELGRPQLRH
ncbi:SpoIIE family protein phosphatase [Streptomyces flavidovirens]|uniref:SpoIIE family protein phosphatase n=1 Tax=Streptomyces flavidovirens TaxID=67298 RepID=UPI00341C029D